MFRLAQNTAAMAVLQLLCLSTPVFSTEGVDCSSARDALIRLSADRMDAVFGDLADSSRALVE